MDNLIFLNRGSTDTRVKLVSLDGNPITTNSAGAIFGEGNELGFCLRADSEVLEMLKPGDSGVIRLQGSFTFEFEGRDIYGNYTGTKPTHIVDASNFGKLIEAEYSDYLQVEIPPDAPQPDPENGVPFSYILKTKFRECWVRIYRLNVDSNLSADAIGNGSAAWMDEDVQNGAIFHFGDSVTPSPTPLTYTANGNTSLVVSPYPGESVKVMVDWGYGWFNTYDVTTPLTQIDWTASTSLKNVRIFFDRPIEGLGISNVVALTEWGSAEISRVRFNHFWHNTSYTGRLVPDHIPTYLTDLSGMFQDTFSEDSFNEDISMWDVSHVTDMSYMFRGAQHFNQDLSGWCVTNITSLPTDFATNSGLTEDKYPVWGTCPFKGLSLISFESNGKDIRLGASATGFDSVKSYAVNDQNVVVRELTDLEIFKLPAGNYTLYCKVDELPEGVTVDKLRVFAQYEGLVRVNKWSQQPVEYVAISWTSYPSEYLVGVPAVRPNTVTNEFTGLFAGAATFNDPNVVDWDVSAVTSLSGIFSGCTAFNQPIGNWNTGNVTTTANAFSGCNNFNQDLSNWNVSKVTDMSQMFINCHAFNQPLNSWNVANVTRMSGMFNVAIKFNQPLNNWKVNNVTRMDSLFRFAKAFNQPIGNWNVGKVTTMDEMFNTAEMFDQDLTTWCVTNITRKPSSFSNYSPLTAEHKPVWGTCPFRGVSLLKFTSTRDDVRVKLTSSAGVEQRTYIVNTATGQQASSIVGSTVINVGAGDWTLYCKEDTLTVPVSDLVLQVTGDGLTHVHEWSKQPIGEMSLYNQSQSYGTSPNLIKVPAVRPNSTQTSFNSFLNGASRFNDPSISEWDMSGVTNLVGFFGYCTVFDQSLANWDTSEVLYMADMFRGAKAFNQPLDTWDVSKVRNMSGLFRETNLFNQPLDSWNTGSATNMEYMFAETMSFNQPLDNWDVSNVTTMRRMFWFASAFTQPLPSWKVGNVTDMEDMFSGTPDYDYDLSMWCVTNITSRPSGFRDLQGALILDPVWGTCPNGS